MSTFTPLSPISVAFYTALNVAGLTALAPGGVHDDVPQNTTYPYVLFEVSEDQQLGGFGTLQGTKALPEIGWRVHIFTQGEGYKTAQAIAAKVLQLLATPPAVTGYGSWAIFHDTTIPLGDELVAGVRVKELVVTGRLYVEEA